MVEVDREQSYLWYISNSNKRIPCDLLYFGKMSLYGFINEPDLNLIEEHDLRLFTTGKVKDI